MRVQCLAQEHNRMTQAGFDPESSAVTTRPPHLPHTVLCGRDKINVLYMYERSTQARKLQQAYSNSKGLIPCFDA